MKIGGKDSYVGFKNHNKKITGKGINNSIYYVFQASNLLLPGNRHDKNLSLDTFRVDRAGETKK